MVPQGVPSDFFGRVILFHITVIFALGKNLSMIRHQSRPQTFVATQKKSRRQGCDGGEPQAGAAAEVS
jgi:hypothetical protein